MNDELRDRLRYQEVSSNLTINVALDMNIPNKNDRLSTLLNFWLYICPFAVFIKSIPGIRHCIVYTTGVMAGLAVKVDRRKACSDKN